MSEEGNAAYCTDYTFHCSEEENDKCAELEAKYPECDDEYVGDMVCAPSTEDEDYYRENCEGDDEEEPMPEDAVLCPGFMESEFCDCSGIATKNQSGVAVKKPLRAAKEALRSHNSAAVRIPLNVLPAPMD